VFKDEILINRHILPKGVTILLDNPYTDAYDTKFDPLFLIKRF
jgi:hypothetical protein